MKTVLTGVKPTGHPHLGNYLGAMRPAIALAKKDGIESLLFIADYHSLTTVHDAKTLREWTYDVAAVWLACGLDPQKTILYRQSDVPEIFELTWILSCFTPKGLMNRAHAYKAKVQANEEAGKKDLDFGVSMGLYLYPVLMSADILMFNADQVPVGEDQIQHVEIARDIAQKFNRTYGETIKVPEFVVDKNSKLIPGLDGRKMSKSYGNTIPLFAPEKKLRKHCMKVKTDSSAPEEPKDPDNSLVFGLYKEFASPAAVAEMRETYKKGISWGEAKQALFEAINSELKDKRQIYDDLMAHPQKIEEILSAGAQKARQKAQPLLSQIREKIGLKR